MKRNLLFASLLIMFWACNQENELRLDSDVQLEFSVDTLRFDTVFTELGSATRIVKVYNRYDQRIRISNISLENSTGVTFRMNVDGIPAESVQNIEIEANDSLYIFSEVTVDPDKDVSASPFVAEGKIKFVTNENEQQVVLEAWGQNANYIPFRNGKGTFSVVNDFVMDDPKPYVIYGGLIVENGTLTMPAGTQVYVHGGLVRADDGVIYNDGSIFISGSGRIKIEGTQENPVIIQGDRLEENFLDESGQWTGIAIGKLSRGNTIEHAVIRNCRFAVQVDSAATLDVKNAQFYNTASSAVIGFNSRITMSNSLIYNNGFHSILLLHGGDYQFDYCTVASYGGESTALWLSNFFCYVQDGFNCLVPSAYRVNARFRNSIFYGSRRDELILEDAIETPEGFNYQFENCVVRVTNLLEEDSFPDFFENCDNCPQDLTATTPLFLDTNEDNYRLDSLSIALNLGTPIEGITTDLEGNQRDPENPDIGCFERQE